GTCGPHRRGTDVAFCRSDHGPASRGWRYLSRLASWVATARARRHTRAGVSLEVLVAERLRTGALNSRRWFALPSHDRGNREAASRKDVARSQDDRDRRDAAETSRTRRIRLGSEPGDARRSVDRADAGVER